MSWLESYKNIKQENGVDLGEYITNYHNVSWKLVKKGILSIFLQGTWFLQGLLEKVQENMVRWVQINITRPETVQYQKIKRMAEEMENTAQTVSLLYKKEYCGEKSKEMLEEFEDTKD